MQTHSTAAGVYVVFFRYDSANLTPVARQIVDQAAASAKAMNATKIQVAGYLDNASVAPNSRQYSQPRFEAVERALVEDGISANNLSRAQLPDIDTELPPTADRRIEIRLNGS